MSSSLPDSPGKAIEYVLVFLPGFICLGLFMYLTDVAFTDFSFTYLSVALSVFLYVAVAAISSMSTARRAADSDREFAFSTRVALTTVTTIALSVGLVLLYESQIVISAIRWINPKVVLKSSERSPLVSLIGADADGSLYKRDDRPAGFRVARTSDNLIAPYSLYVRVRLGDDEFYEGRPTRFGSRREDHGFPLVLSPACRVVVESGGAERHGRIFGPGVYVAGKDVMAVELLEMGASKCWQCFYAEDAKEDKACFDTKAEVKK